MLSRSLFTLNNNKNTIRKLSNYTTASIFNRELKRKQKNNIILKHIQSNNNDYEYLRQEAAYRIVDRLDDILLSFPLALEIGCYRQLIGNIIQKSRRDTYNGNDIHPKGGYGGIEKLIETESVYIPPQLDSLDENEMNLNDNDKKIRLNNIKQRGKFIIDSHPMFQFKPNELCQELIDTNNKIGENKFQPGPLSRTFIQIDEEFLPFKKNTFDLIYTSLNMHWINDIPSTFKQINNILKPNGAFLGIILGGKTLEELRHCFYLAEEDRLGEYNIHTSPLTRPSDIGNILSETGFTIPSVDIDDITVIYPDVFTLIEHLDNMSEGFSLLLNENTLKNRTKKDIFLAMASIYQELYGIKDDDEGGIKATFQFITFIGWKEHESQIKPCSRGSGTKSLKDLSTIMNEIENEKKNEKKE